MSKSLLLIIFLFAFNQSSILTTNVVLEEGNAIYEFSYFFPKDASNMKILYRKVGQDTWQDIILTQSNGEFT